MASQQEFDALRIEIDKLRNAAYGASSGDLILINAILLKQAKASGNPQKYLDDIDDIARELSNGTLADPTVPEPLKQSLVERLRSAIAWAKSQASR
ncbi:hypothetical protein [Herminiimonas contaminans]|uniref:Uncharacterized protein n=1 Tax=Herminiimonas contaminans TaxID=1111140 RepID=A0ABS0EQU9_9BURK|nr:hypothetical protein [Herminiimonas contaminans]MBF8177233.1 hypothetical protein [Herminiimonas contaminans]